MKIEKRLAMLIADAQAHGQYWDMPSTDYSVADLIDALSVSRSQAYRLMARFASEYGICCELIDTPMGRLLRVSYKAISVTDDVLWHTFIKHLRATWVKIEREYGPRDTLF